MFARMAHDGWPEADSYRVDGRGWIVATMKDTSMLTADGARLLRAARDQIVANPETFNMGAWECGTTACIAGHILRVAGVKWPFQDQSKDGAFSVTAAINRLLGFAPQYGVLFPQPIFPQPIGALFFNWGLEHHQVAEAVNAVLWHYGYPPSEVADASATAEDAVAAPIDQPVSANSR